MNTKNVGITDAGNAWRVEWGYPAISGWISKDIQPNKPTLAEVFEDEASRRRRLPAFTRQMWPNCRCGSGLSITKKDKKEISFLEELSATCRKREVKSTPTRSETTRILAETEKKKQRLKELDKQLEESQRQARVFERMAIRSRASLYPPNWQDVKYDSEKTAWRVLDSLNRTAKDIFGDKFKPVKMLVEDKNYQDDTQFQSGVIRYQLDTPDNKAALAVSHEWCHGAESQGLLEEIEEIFEGNCTSGASYFGKAFEQVWKTYGNNSQDFNGCLKRLLEKCKK